MNTLELALSGIAADGTNEIFKILLFISAILFGGVLFGKLAEMVKLPHISGYLIGGLIIGMSADHVMHDLTTHSEGALDVISKIALGFIAFTVGTELWWPKIKKSGKEIIIITIIQAFIPTILVAAVLILVGIPAWVALPLGAIASITAPGPMLAIVKKFKAKGPLTTKIFPIVGLDDALGIITFSILISIGISMVSGSTFSIASLEAPVKEIVLSIVWGLVIGIPLGLLIKHSTWWSEEKHELFLSMSIIVVLIAVALAEILVLSPILCSMVIGATFTNMVDKPTFKFEEHVLEGFSPPILTIFFTIAGVELGLKLDTSVIETIWLATILYVVVRTFGKILGGWAGAKAAGIKEKSVGPNIGKLLLPQGGVEIGLSIVVVSQFTHVFDTLGISGTYSTGLFPGNLWEPIHIKAIVLIIVIIFGLIGPIFVKQTLMNVGEITQKSIAAGELESKKTRKKNLKRIKKLRKKFLKEGPQAEDWHHVRNLTE